MTKKEINKLERIRTLINAQLNENCANCNFLQIINLEKQKVICPYLIKNKCLINNCLFSSDGRITDL